MADPRVATTTRDGTDPKRNLTFKADGADIVFSSTAPGGSLVVGRAVTQTGQASGVVRLAGAGDRITGKLLHVESDGYCGVQTSGVVTLPKGDGAVAVADKIVGETLAAVRGYIRGAAQHGAAYAEAAADDQANGVGRVIDVATSTAIEVEL